MGFLLLALAVIGVVYALVMKNKGNRILAAPFHKTGEAKPANADPKGMISVEGNVHAEQPLLSPCTGQPCLAYRVDLYRDYEKESVGSDGKVSTSKGSDNIETIKLGSVFAVDDGSGKVLVDITEGADAEEKKTFEDKVKLGLMIPGELNFGNLRIATPRLPKDSRTLAFRAVEKIVPVEPKLFVLGKVEDGSIKKPKWRSMMLSAKGRDGLLAHTAKHAKGGFIAAAVMAAVSAPVIAFVDLAPKKDAAQVAAHVESAKTAPAAPEAAPAQADDAAQADAAKPAELPAAAPAVQVPPTNSKLHAKHHGGVATAHNPAGASHTTSVKHHK